MLDALYGIEHWFSIGVFQNCYIFKKWCRESKEGEKRWSREKLQIELFYKRI